jgi:hypothetical protein
VSKGIFYEQGSGRADRHNNEPTVTRNPVPLTRTVRVFIISLLSFVLETNRDTRAVGKEECVAKVDNGVACCGQ